MDMTQKEEFVRRRSALLKQHLENDPKLRAARRRQKYRFGFGVFQYVIAVAVALFLLKSFALAFYGAESYARLMAPVAAQLEPTHPLYQAVMPDPASSAFAETIRQFLPDRPVATSMQGPAGTTAPDRIMPIEAVPES